MGRLEIAKRTERDGLSATDRSVAARKAEALTDQLDGIVLDLYGINPSSAALRTRGRSSSIAPLVVFTVRGS